MKTTYIVLIVGLLILSCERKEDKHAQKLFETSFESIDDFSGFYLTPQGHLGTSFHELTDSIVYDGTFAHRAWINGVNPPSTNSVNNNHRAYPTIQLQKTSSGVFNTPCYITFWVCLDIELQEDTAEGEDDWFSFATFTDDQSDSWKRTILVNLSHDGFVHLGHVPNQGEQIYVFQTTSIPFPQKEWVELKVFLDFTNDAYAKVWQNGELVSHAKIEGITNKLSQVHLGLYCSPQLANGVVYNDKLCIQEVDSE